MRKISLISAAVLAAFSMSAVAKDANTDDVAQPVTLKPGDAVYETITIGNASDDFLEHFLKIHEDTTYASISNVIMKGTFVDGENPKPGSYIKTWGKSLEIGSLSLQAGTQGNMGQGIIEFWGQSGANQSVKVGTLSVGTNAVLRIQESTSFGNNPITSVNVSEVNLGSNSALAFGSVDKYGTDTASIDSLYAVDGGVSAVANVHLSGTRVQLGEINVKDTVLTFSGSDDLPEGTELPIDIPLNPVAVEGQPSNGGNIAVNMLGTDSKLFFADVGSNEAENQTTLNVNFSQEAFNSDTSIVTFTRDASVEGTILNLSAENVAKETNAENVDVLNALAKKVDTRGDQEFADTSLTATSDVYDTVTAKTGADGKVDTSTMKTYENAEVFSFAQLHSVGVMQWREEMNHMQLRLGEIRDAAGHNNGAWARIYNGKDEYGSQDVENKYYGMQIGFDHRLENSNWIIGGAFSYARGDSTFSTGEGDNHNFAFTGYGTWLGENGLFVDVTGKVGRLSNDITIDHYTSDYDTNAVSVTAEAGWRFTLNDMFYVEPQAEMMYGHIMGASYKTLNYKADTEDVDMWVGRLGFQTGLTCPAKKGGIYFRASVLHDFDGDAETKFTGLKSGNTRTLLDELGGTWYEMGLGANYNVTDSTYVYADFQYANGGEIDTPWRWNLGVRYSF